MVNETNDYGMPHDGKILNFGDLYSYKMDAQNRGAQCNFEIFVSILNKKFDKSQPPFEFYIYILAGICNQYGIDKERTAELIWQKFKEHKRVYEECFSSMQFKKKLQVILLQVYGQFSSAHGSWHKEREDEDKEETPKLPETIYQDLPPVLKHLAKYFPSERERDVFLLSALGVLSSCFPNIKGVYDNNLVGMNLFIFISAPASAGKGVMIWARRLGEELHKDLENQYKQLLTEYEEAMSKYKDAVSNGEETVLPVKPERQLFFIPANSSASKIIQTLKANGNFGVILDTEADTLSQALGNETWGNFSDTLRKVFHHEPIELQRKMNDEYISIEKSFLSVVLSGTPNQIQNLLSSIENGFFSRFIFYDFPMNLNWKNVFDRTAESPDGEFYSKSVEVARYFKQVSEKAAQRQEGHIVFSLSQEQEKRFNKWFSEKQCLLHHIYGDQIIASLRRLGLITFRIAMILTTIRNIRTEPPLELHCNDTDFDIASSITNTLLSHTIKIYNQLKRHGQMKSASGRKTLFLEKLPDTFQRSAAMDIASLLGIKEKTAENYITGLINEGLLERKEQNQYQKL